MGANSEEPLRIDLTEEGRAVKSAVVRFEERWPPGVTLQYDTLRSRIRIYDYYPFLFYRVFPTAPIDRIRKLALAGRLFFSALLLCDRLMDRTSPAHIATPDGVRTQALLFEANLVLNDLFAPNCDFWRSFQSFMADYADACLTEQAFASGARLWKEYDEATALRIAIGKNGVARTAVVGLAELVGDWGPVEPLVESIDSFNVAFQMLDDLKDCREDLRAGIPSLLLARVVSDWSDAGHGETRERWIEQRIREIYYQGHAHYVLDLALDALRRAASRVAELPLVEWRPIIAELEERCLGLRPEIEQVIASNRRRAQESPSFELCLPPAEGALQRTAWQALRIIVRQWQLGFGEAKHLMSFQREESLGLEPQLQAGDTFQRAVIADILCDADEVLEGHLRLVTDHECAYLLSRRSKTGIGGWSYFPEMPQLAPDADDLAQVIQVFLRTGRRAEVREHCEPPLRVLLEECSHPEGSFETWIIPAAARSPEQETQDEYARLAWGTGADNEVVANLLYALSFYDPVRFREDVERGLRFLESRQHAEGWWQSSWYHGPYYGTYVCLRLLARERSTSPAIGRALHFLRESQRLDGGWSIDGRSDTLSTALALLGLAAGQAADEVEPEDAERLSQALRFLESEHQTDGWPVCPFIRMVLGRPAGKVRNILTYGSRTITAAYVLKALLAWDRLLQPSTSRQVSAHA